MATLMAFVVLSALSYLTYWAYLAYWDGRRGFGGRRSGNPVLARLDRELDPNGPLLDRLDLDRLRRDMDAASGHPDPPGHSPPDTTKEASETALTHQLLAGTIEPFVYPRLMSDLAHPGIHTEGTR